VNFPLRKDVLFLLKYLAIFLGKLDKHPLKTEENSN
jgi:hypothetical protein